MSPTKVKIFIQDDPVGLVRNNKPEVGLKLPTFSFNISMFKSPPWTLLTSGTHIHTEISQIPVFKDT